MKGYVALFFLFLGCGLSPQKATPEKELKYQTSGIIQYMQNPAVSTIDGTPSSCRTFYFPPQTAGRTDDGYMLTLDERTHEMPDSVKPFIDSTKLSLFSYPLYKFDEPILCNYYLGKEIIRLTAYPGMTDEPFVISIIKSSDSISFQAKTVDYQIRDYPLRSMKCSDLRPLTYRRRDYPMSDREASLIDSLISESFKANEHYWTKFEMFDGPSLILEVHKADGYLYKELGSSALDVALLKAFAVKVSYFGRPHQ